MGTWLILLALDASLTNEVIVCVFHQGPSQVLNMTDCSLAAHHL